MRNSAKRSGDWWFSLGELKGWNGGENASGSGYQGSASERASRLLANSWPSHFPAHLIAPQTRNAKTILPLGLCFRYPTLRPAVV